MINRSYLQKQAGLLWLLIGLVSGACPAIGQVAPKKPLTEADYHLWGRMEFQGLSPDGKWASWTMRYENGKDTLFVKNTATGRVHELPSANGQFAGNTHFAYQSADSFVLLDLQKGTRWQKSGVNEFYASAEAKSVVLKTAHDLEVLDWSGSTRLKIPKPDSWSFDAGGKTAAIAVKDGDSARLVVVDLKTFTQKTVASAKTKRFNRPKWSEDGKRFAFVQPGDENASGKVYCFTSDGQTVSVFEPDMPGMRVTPSGLTPLTFSRDGSRIFFGIGPKKKPEKMDPMVEVWNASDKVIYPVQRTSAESPISYLCMFDIPNKKFLQIANAEHWEAALTGSSNFALVWDPLAYEPQHFREFPDVDYYLVDLHSGSRKLLFKKLPLQSVLPSCVTDAIAYQTPNGWKLYDPQNEKTINLDKIPTYKRRWHRQFVSDPTPIFDLTGQYVLTRDSLDVWKTDIRSGKSTRLTDGFKSGRSYYPIASELEFRIANYGVRNARTIDLRKTMMLETRNDYEPATGYFLLNAAESLKKLVYGSHGYKALRVSEDGKTYAFTAESFEDPTMLFTSDGKKQQLMAQSNTHQRDYAWGSARFISYTVGGKKLHGILHIPANPKPGNQNPMVVSVYEKQSDGFFRYYPISLMSGAGFNLPHLLSKGFYVFQPDIVYSGNVGQDATKCTLAGIDKVLETYPIDPKKIGLHGHSFGGYEACAIATRTDRFTAIVACNPWAETIALYLYPGLSNMRPDYWRFTDGQARISKGLFDAKEQYLEQSPALNADRVQTPMLFTIGEKDYHVFYMQGVSMHMALRSLNKQSTMLFYPDVGHSFNSKESGEDVTRRTTEWFEHFLMGKPVDWIK